jgi:hypothetical protein
MDPAWDEYRRRRRMFLWTHLLLPLWVSGAIVLEFFAGREFPRTGLVTFVAVLLPPMACLMFAYLRWIFWPCPSCGRPFFLTWLGNNCFARRCLHCGLPKWAPGKAESPKFGPLDRYQASAGDDFEY